MKRILLADGDPLVLRVYGDGLRARGFEVQTAADGVAAARALRNAKPDAIVLDLMMPRLSGADVLKYIRGQSYLANLPVVVLSHDYMTDLTRQAAAAGAHKRLMKSECTPAVIAEAIEGLLSGQDANGDRTGSLVQPCPTTYAGVPKAEPSFELRRCRIVESGTG